ncbi:hypothetical protein Ancab_031176 [Ancistrocladus abbreviatus]
MLEDKPREIPHQEMTVLRKRQLACLSLLVLMLLPSETPVFADGHGRFNKLKSGSSSSSSEHNYVKGQSFFKGNAKKNADDDVVFDDEKRKIHTGPNPLHNR